MTPLLILLALLPLQALSHRNAADRKHHRKQVQESADPYELLKKELEEKYRLFDQAEEKPKAVITQRPLKSLSPFQLLGQSLPRQEEEAEHPVQDFSMQKYSKAQEKVCTAYSDRASP